MASVEELYNLADILTNAGEKASEHENEYLKIVTTTEEGGSNEKRLASQLMCKYFKSFQHLSDKVFEAMVAICETDDTLMQKQAIKDLYTLAENGATDDNIQRIAFCLAQLTLVEDPTALSMIFRYLEKMMKLNFKATIQGLLQVMVDPLDEVTVVLFERTLKFVAKQLKSGEDRHLDKELEESLLEQCKKRLEACSSKEEMSGVISLMGSLQCMQSLTGRQEMVDKVATHSINTENALQVKDTEGMERIVSCCKMVVPFFSKNVQSTKFVSYFCEHLIPLVKDVESPAEGEGEGLKEDIVKTFAEICAFTGELTDYEDKITALLTLLKEYMPLPDASVLESNAEPNLLFSDIEKLLFAFYHLCKKHPQYLANEGQAERLNDLRQRLQFVARCLSILIKPIKEALRAAKPDELRGGEAESRYAMHVMTARINTNVTQMIKDLFHSPPIYKCQVVLAHRAAHTAQAAAGEDRGMISPPGGKRSSSSGESNGVGGKRDSRQIYHPPSGKFSDKAGPAPQLPAGGRGRGRRGRGGGRYSY